MVSPTDPAEVALDVFAGWLSRREAGDGSEFEELVRSRRELAPELEALHATWKDLAAGVDLLSGSLQDSASRLFDPDAVVSRLAKRESSSGRYRLEGEVARGGMGAILRVFDEDFRRALAMKVALDAADPRGTPGAGHMTPKVLARFLAEAQITGQLDHPGIVPVHEIGLGDDGRLYFTMKLVEGRDLKHVFELVFAGREDWNLTRALGVILKACEAIAYAHRKGVIHRDLKPANIMVGSFGEVFVMDWGLARVLGCEDVRDLRVTEGAGSSPLAVRTDRNEVGAAPDSTLFTMDGDVLGTPAYMPPEQARGEIENLTPRSDVYSVGAMLYHLLGEQAPYVAAGERPSHSQVLGRVIAGPPRALHALRDRLPGELVAICEKAMTRDPAARYPDMLALAEDLRAYLERRVVAAYETGTLAELKKWVARNKALAAASAALVLSVTVGFVVSASLFVKAKAETARADAKAAEAEHRTDDVLSLSAIQDLEELVDRADAAWPAHPENIPVYEAWLVEARMLVDGFPGDSTRGVKPKPGLVDHERKLAEIEQRGTAREAPREEGAVQDGDRRIEWEFASSEDRWWHAQLARLIADLEEFSDPATGLVSTGTNAVHGWGIEQRLEFAREIEERSVSGPRAAELWAEAIASIADPARCPLYAGLTLSPQLGLLPIGRDPRTGLWEFAHLKTGEPAERGANGVLARGEALGLVLVLVPGGTFVMGAQREDPGAPNFDPYAEPSEAPPHAVTLDPYFLSKYEMTQAQWLRFCGANPSDRRAGKDKQATLENPVERVTWNECTTLLAKLDLRLPTEAQWERAARAASSSVWGTGDEPESIDGFANLADSYCKNNGGPGGWVYDEWLDDGYTSTAPVGSFLQNRFGMHDMLGNVWEWCRDGFARYDRPVGPKDGERAVADSPSRALRGCGFGETTSNARVATRMWVAPSGADGTLGLRPARDVR